MKELSEINDSSYLYHSVDLNVMLYRSLLCLPVSGWTRASFPSCRVQLSHKQKCLYIKYDIHQQNKACEANEAD